MFEVFGVNLTGLKITEENMKKLSVFSPGWIDDNQFLAATYESIK